jgi:hypothetical protein
LDVILDEAIRLLANYGPACYARSRILEVFGVNKATKTFDFAAFFCAGLLRFES